MWSIPSRGSLPIPKSGPKCDNIAIVDYNGSGSESAADDLTSWDTHVFDENACKVVEMEDSYFENID